jgi:O-antigen ligase
MRETKSVIPARIASWLLFVIVALAPLPFGSVEPATTAIWCIALGACLILASTQSVRGGRLALAVLAAFVVGAYALVLHEQLAAQPWLWAATPHPIWHEAQTALGQPLLPSVSIARNQPWFALGRPLVCMLAIACAFLIGTDRWRARQLIGVIAWSGAAYAAYGIVAHVLDPSHILGQDKQAYFESVTGTFINRNTAGAYFGTCAVVWLLLLLERLRPEKLEGPLAWRAMVLRLFSAPSKEIIIAFAVLFLCLAAMFMTRSRGAVLASLLALAIAFTAFFKRDLARWSGFAVALIGAGGVGLFLLQLMGAGVNARFDVQGLADEGRIETYRATLRMIADHPWFGTGLGTFPEAFPAYRSPNVSVWGVWDLAHNTLLEIAAEMGVPIAALVAIAWVVIVAVLFRGTVVRRRDLVFPVVGLATAVLAVSHSLIDFSLQMPGYAIVALSLIGAGLTQSFSAEPGRIEPPSARRAQSADRS